ncbi:ABC transporter permease subunit [Streptomyces sp. CB01580]|uniref:ABC transporter permease subunit n=1 Tax=Streptomyces sp. CB01580 TaxID=1703933 RepID=UPI00093B0440|nr:ABC transporter permease subunit [Streptomyces sp. CB01580]OKJ21137.1 ABC transporter [Streptomyces sp. CB01580]
MTTPPTTNPRAPGQQHAPLPHGNGQQAPAGYYASPIPLRPATLTDAITSEWTKIRSVRSTVWTLGVMLTVVLGLGLLITTMITLTDSDLGDVPELSFGFFGVLLGSICVITLGVLTITSEYGTGLIRTTLTACPSRTRVLTAKAAVFFVLTFAVTTVSATVVAVVQASLLHGKEPRVDDWLRATIGVGLYVALLGLLSLAVGAIVRHSAGAVTIMIGVVLLPLVLGIFMFSRSLAGLREAFLMYSIPSQLSAFYDTSVTGFGPSGWDSLWIMLGVTAVAMGAAYAVLERRDV